MGDLRDQLKNAKLLSKKDEKRLAHEARVHRKEVGREGLDAEARAKQDELDRLRAAERETDRERQQRLDEEKRQYEERAACLAILRTEVQAPDRRGSIRWYFETATGQLPWLMLGQGEASQLASGALCVVRRDERDTHAYGLLAAEHARRVRAVFPDRIVWIARGAAR